MADMLVKLYTLPDASLLLKTLKDKGMKYVKRSRQRKKLSLIGHINVSRLLLPPSVRQPSNKDLSLAISR